MAWDNVKKGKVSVKKYHGQGAKLVECKEGSLVCKKEMVNKAKLKENGDDHIESWRKLQNTYTKKKAEWKTNHKGRRLPEVMWSYERGNKEMEMIWETESFNGQGCRRMFCKLFSSWTHFGLEE